MIKNILYNPWVVLTLSTFLVIYLSYLFNKWYDNWLFRHRTKQDKVSLVFRKHFK